MDIEKKEKSKSRASEGKDKPDDDRIADGGMRCECVNGKPTFRDRVESLQEGSSHLKVYLKLFR